MATLPANSEVIVVDNGSTDGSADFLASGCGCYENVHLIQTPDQLGVAGARNRGLAQAQGEIVVFADAHLDLPERWWQPIACVLTQPKVGVVGPGIGVMGMPERPAACGQRIAESKLRVEWLPWKGGEPRPIRASDSAEARITAYLEPGVMGDIKRCREGWCQISGSGYSGWIARDQLWGVYPDEDID